MMNQEVKKLWIEALRSGEYQQGYGALCCGNTYCCLGVLTDLFMKQFPGIIKKRTEMFEINSTFTEKIDGVKHDEKYSLLPSVVKWANFDSSDPEVCFSKNKCFGVTLSILNDGGSAEHPQHNFNQIADLIEQDETL